jgi:hypothetical protein
MVKGGEHQCPAHPLLVLGGELESYIEQLHDRQSDDNVGGDFHSAARFADRLYYLDHVSGRLQQPAGEFVEMIGGAAKFIQYPRGLDQSRG